MIFDEISSGFRLSIGGLYKLHDLEPDIVVLGKALGNGFGISAVLGKREIMEESQRSFISSSYWTERTSYAASVETIKQFEKHSVIEYLKELGDYYRYKMSDIFKENNISILGMPTVPNLVFMGDENRIFKTVFTQEMLKLGFLASNVLYLSYAHTEKVIDKYYQACEKVFLKIEERKKMEILQIY